MRLSTILAGLRDRLGSINRLVCEINNANEAARTGLKVNNNTLTSVIGKPETVKFTLHLLRAIDTYLDLKGLGLSDHPLFEKRSVMEAVTERTRITFLLGSRPRERERRNDLSRWDTRSLAEILTDASKSGFRLEYDIQDVIRTSARREADVAHEDWYKALLRKKHAFIAFGSPLACLASEIMLAKMFCVMPFQKPPPGYASGSASPFYYIWPRERGHAFQSAFELTANEVGEMDKHLANEVRKNRRAGFLFSERPDEKPRLKYIPTKASRWQMYGTIVAQRRSNGAVWIVISGISGPATYAAATLLKEMKKELPRTPGKDSPILWAPIVATITEGPRNRHQGDHREMEKCELIGKPQEWPRK